MEATAIDLTQAEKGDISDWIDQTSSRTMQEFYRRLREYYSRKVLTDDGSDISEVKKFYRGSEQTPCVRQNISFFDLSPELRNKIYDLVLPKHGVQDALVIASPFHDGLMTIAEQPAITRVSRQTRTESLAMFYAHNHFVAYIQDFNFRALFDWVRCVTSGPTELPRTRVHVKLSEFLTCEYPILSLVKGWMALRHDKITLKIHNLVSAATTFPPDHVSRTYDQRQVVADAIGLAERLKQDDQDDDATVELACSVLLGKYGLERSGCKGREAKIMH